MNLIVTIGPTQEPLDAMRILSNRSTGALGTRLAELLANEGHNVIALRGTGSTASQKLLQHDRIRTISFTSTENLRQELEKLTTTEKIDAVFHAAAVSDFYLPGAGIGKIPTKNGALTLTLEPTPKLLPRMRDWFPKALITGWKFEASGDQSEALAAAALQISACNSDACVVNGPSYGKGFGVLTKSGERIHLEDRNELCRHLVRQLRN